MSKPLLHILLFIILGLLFMNCGRSRRHGNDRQNKRINAIVEQGSSTRQRSFNTKSIVRMRNANGVYYVPCKINGTEMQFIFDTGASDITMSATEAIFLYKQGKLRADDFIGAQEYLIADGSVHEGVIVMLRTVEIGNRTLKNVQASIVNNFEAPLLLGQSALSKFGIISIDYKRNEIAFE